jgi:hypothetical protein
MNRSLARALLALVALTVAGLSCTPSSPAHSLGMVNAPPIINPSWTAPAWFIDPANSTGLANDGANSGQSASQPLLTWNELNAHRWACSASANGIDYGSPCPRLQQNTTITFMSSQSGFADPVYFAPTLEGGVWVNMVGTPTCATGGALSNVTTGGGATRAALELAQLTVTPTAGQFLVNTTHPGAAWAVALSSGSIWQFSQPLARTVVPQTTPAELSTWANVDVANLCTLPSLDVVSVQPIVADNSAAFSNFVYMTNLAVTGPVGNGFDHLTVNHGVSMQECSSTREVFGLAQQGPFPVYHNNYLPAGVAGDMVGATVSGGVMGNPIDNLYSIQITGDIVLNGASPLRMQGVGQIGNAYVATGAILTPLGNIQAGGALLYSGGVVWGPGTLNAGGNGRVTYPSGAGSAAAHFTVTTLQINGQTKGCLTFPANAATTLTCNITVTAANLDTNLGATNTGCVSGGGAAAGFCNGAQ